MLSNTLDFWKNLKGSAPFLEVPLRIFVSDVFGGGSKVIGKSNVNFCANWNLFHSTFSKFSSLVAESTRKTNCSSVGVLKGFLYLSSLFKRGSKILGGTAS